MKFSGNAIRKLNIHIRWEIVDKVHLLYVLFLIIRVWNENIGSFDNKMIISLKFNILTSLDHTLLTWDTILIILNLAIFILIQ